MSPPKNPPTVARMPKLIGADRLELYEYSTSLKPYRAGETGMPDTVNASKTASLRTLYATPAEELSSNSPSKCRWRYDVSMTPSKFQKRVKLMCGCTS